MASITWREERDEWEVRWSEWSVETDPTTGAQTKRRVQRRRGCRTKAIAQQLARKVEDALALGQHPGEPPPPPIFMRSIVVSWLRSAQDGGLKDATLKTRASLIEPWLVWWGERPLSDLTLAKLEAYSHTLPRLGRAAATRHRKVLVVEQLWRWAWARRTEYPGLPEPAQLTGIGAGLAPPPPVVATAAPTWAEVDAMLAQLRIPWHRMAVLLMRYLGLRASQVCGLEWRDVLLDRQIVRIRAGVRGAKKGRARVLPIHPALLTELAAWATPEARTGPLFPRRYRTADGQHRTGPYRGDALLEPLRRAWTLANVPPDRWDIPAPDADADPDEVERAHGSPSHAIRRCIRSELLRAGVEEAVVLHLVGHTSGHTAAAYVPESSPDQSPWWPRMLEALKKIPPHPLRARIASS